MTNGTADFVKHKFDMLILILVIVTLEVVLNKAGWYHDAGLLTWTETTISGLVGALISMAVNRSSASERASDIPGTTTVTQTNPSPPAKAPDVEIKTPNVSVSTSPTEVPEVKP